MIGPGDYEAFPNDGDPRDPRNDYDNEAETLTPEQERKAEEEAAYDKWESRQ